MTTTTASKPALAPITERAMLVSLHVSKWSATKTDKAASREVEEQHGADRGTAKVAKLLVPKNAVEPINGVVNIAGAHVRRCTLPWGEHGERILSSLGYPRCIITVRDLESDFWRAVDEFLANWPEHKRLGRQQTGTLFDEADYPTEAALRECFSWDFEVWPLPKAEDFRVDVGNLEIEKIRQSVQDNMDKRLAGTVVVIFERTQEVLQRMIERLRAFDGLSDGDKQPRLYDTVVTDVRDLVDLMPTWNLTGDPSIDMMAKAMQDLCRFDAKDLKSDEAARTVTVQKAEQICALVSDYLA